MQYNFKNKSQRRLFYKSNTWRGVNGIRNQVVERDGNECIWCKEQGLVTTKEMGTLEVDHIIPVEECTYEQAIDLNNLRTLCSYHHNVRHNRFNGRLFKDNNKKFDDEKW